MFEFRRDQQGSYIMRLSFQENKLTCAKEYKLKVHHTKLWNSIWTTERGDFMSFQGKGFTMGQALGNATNSEDDFDRLV